MRLHLKDPLLTAARLLITLCMGLAILIGAATLIAAPVMVVARDQVLSGMVTELGQPVSGQAIWAIAVILLLIAAMAACAFGFLHYLRRIIDSVGMGDPFEPANATRLARMGWLAIAIELLSIPVGAIGQWLADTIKDATADFGISLNGLLLALILFILARVFRHGAAMREELEATV
jgi:hypothetical protein